MERIEKRLSGEDYKTFIQFMRKILRWLPEERPTAAELVYDDFLMQAVFTFSTKADGHLSVLDL